MSQPRVVSLVPSDTYSIVAMGGRSRLAGRTRFCVQPPDLHDVPVVGGTKNLDIEAIVRLQPDIVIANKEENSRNDIEALQSFGLNVLITFPKTVKQTASHLRTLALHTGLLDSAPCRRVLERADQFVGDDARRPPSTRCWVPIWRDPWMTINGDTYIGSVLVFLGLENVFADWPSHEQDGADTRYPVVRQRQVERYAPELVLLPDEPYPFKQKHVRELSAWNMPASRNGKLLLISGQDLCWHGAWALDGIARIDRAVRKAFDGPLG